MNGAGGIVAWRWLFIIEGIPSGEQILVPQNGYRIRQTLTVIVGVLVFLFMPNYPENASWLSEAEKAIQRQRLSAGNNSHGWVNLSL